MPPPLAFANENGGDVTVRPGQQQDGGKNGVAQCLCYRAGPGRPTSPALQIGLNRRILHPPVITPYASHMSGDLVDQAGARRLDL